MSRTLLAVGISGASLACVSPPRPVAPVSVNGPVPVEDGSTVMGEPDERAGMGPLRIVAASVKRASGGFSWAVELENPSATTFEVTVVVVLVDEDDAPMASDSIDFVLERRAGTRVERLLESDAEPERFRIEYWARLLPPPDRRVDRIGS